jgi:histidinol dehydrogenase
LKRSSVIGLARDLIRKRARSIAVLAEAEGLHFHAASLEARANHG